MLAPSQAQARYKTYLRALVLGSGVLELRRRIRQQAFSRHRPAETTQAGRSRVRHVSASIRAAFPSMRPGGPRGKVGSTGRANPRAMASLSAVWVWAKPWLSI